MFTKKPFYIFIALLQGNLSYVNKSNINCSCFVGDKLKSAVCETSRSNSYKSYEYRFLRAWNKITRMKFGRLATRQSTVVVPKQVRSFLKPESRCGEIVRSHRTRVKVRPLGFQNTILKGHRHSLDAGNRLVDVRG